MAEGTVECEISAALKKVFDFVADVETHPLYASFVEDVKITSEKTRGKGVTFKQLRKGQERYTDSEILEFVPNKEITWVSRAIGGDVLVRYHFVPVPSGTKVIHTVSSPLLDDSQRLKRSQQDNEEELANLKRLMESESRADNC